MVKTVTMLQDKITKGAVRYAETNDKGETLTGDDSVISQLYVRKAALEGRAPRGAKVTIEFID